jgi:hypothetical protein
MYIIIIANAVAVSNLYSIILFLVQEAYQKMLTEKGFGKIATKIKEAGTFYYAMVCQGCTVKPANSTYLYPWDRRKGSAM